ncbi:uncharacterized protein AB675_10415 [Cyphellophora attinorum]|uniref:Zn(2)-C6 fungal-type domain-containing protein n=1 Tax=Cyphellophora attinorum TaxID=1664694 RepID=A0A0N0NIV5_9EURO|nr:uncharacterized protein AB675_10415 [Phialophora attinorum]KPI35889.1 hypothetical protein AB675_10415 [Phialophora attinorum]
MPQTSGGRLRTKTGCLTCRSRRKKCDERIPVCDRCSASQRKCEWPGAHDLLDRRHVARRGSASSAGSTSSTPRNYSSAQATLAIVVQAPPLSLRSESVSSQIMRRDVEPLVSANFFDNYFDMVLLPDCHPQFYHGSLGEIKDLMTKHPSLYFALLACSAAQVHSLSGTSQLHGLALEYYDRGIKHVSELLDVDSVANHDGLLITIILLYLHGCLGRATFDDVPRHLDAAVGLLRLRLFNGKGGVRQPLDRLAIESSLYQIFLTAAGSWVDPPSSNPQLDTSFWSITLSEPPSADYDAIATLKDELSSWEALLLTNGDLDVAAAQSNLGHYQLYKDSMYLYILIASLLLDQAINTTSDGESVQVPKASTSWQAVRMLRILEQHQSENAWAKFYASNWPLYTCGFFMAGASDQDIVRQGLMLRTEVTGFSQPARFLEELEIVWDRRNRQCDEIEPV